MTPRAADLVESLLSSCDPATHDAREFLGAKFDAGLAWIHFPVGFGGLDLSRALQVEVDALLAAAGAPGPDHERNGIGLGMAAPTIAAFGTDEQKRRFLRPLYVGDELWCQLFSEPGAGSDLASVATRAVRTADEWAVEGQKVWTTNARACQRAILLTRSDRSVVKHAGLTYFLMDMTTPGIDIRPLRQITGEAEFNEVFLDVVHVPDGDRLGDVGDGWRIAMTTLNNERVAIGAGAQPEAGHMGILADRWRSDPGYRDPAALDRLMSLWVETEATRLAGERLRQQLEVSRPGPESSAMKIAFARQAQQLTGLAMELDPDEALVYDGWTTNDDELSTMLSRGPGFRYLRAKGNSIEGGTSEILRNIIAERVLGLPGEARPDKDLAFKDIPR